ncbi:MAG TPA: c-type cytochrome [Caulobacteraceae bacterium]|nr:c-type cytochrome [Caulobacteraceae bacterium]
MTVGRLLAATAVLFAGVAPCAAREAGDAAKGAAVFADRCEFCHAADGGQGPSLAGVIGRKAGGVAGFDYSPAIKASGIVWSRQSLNRFLAGPAAMVPGTAMQISLPDAAMRDDLIAYLATRK